MFVSYTGLNKSWNRCQRRPLTDPAARSFEMRTFSWRINHAMPCLFHSSGCQHWHEHHSRSLQVAQATPSACEASHVLEDNDTIQFRQISRTPSAWESSLRGQTSTSSNSCHHSTNMIPSMHGIVQSASGVRPPWDSTIYRDPLAKSAPDKEVVNHGNYGVLSNDKTAANSGLHPRLVEEEQVQNCDTLTLRAEKGVQCEQPPLIQKSPKKHGSWGATREAWVPPGVHVVNGKLRRHHGLPAGVQVEPLSFPLAHVALQC